MPRKLSRMCWIAVMCFLIGGSAVFADERFTDNGDGTITDHQLGVMWGKIDNQGDVNWKQAHQWVRYTFPDTIEKQYDNWRLPSLEELQSLYVKDREYKGYETDCGHWVKIVPEIMLSCGWVWTSDTTAIQAHIFNFHRGYHYTDRMVHDKAYRALAVRNLE